MHVHDMQAFQAGAFDVSHTINRISFGEDYPGFESPLDDSKKLTEEGEKKKKSSTFMLTGCSQKKKFPVAMRHYHLLFVLMTPR